MKECKSECECSSKYSSEFGRLEVLTDLVEFAQQQNAKGSPYTSGWADDMTLTNWQIQIGGLRAALPECLVKDFDNERKRKRDFVESLIRENDRRS